MKIALDAMGGDFAPQAAIEGALLASEELSAGVEIVLIGRETIIRDLLHTPAFTSSNLSVIHAEEVIEMGEHPTKALTQKNQLQYRHRIWLVKSRSGGCFLQCG